MTMCWIISPAGGGGGGEESSLYHERVTNKKSKSLLKFDPFPSPHHSDRPSARLVLSRAPSWAFFSTDMLLASRHISIMCGRFTSTWF